MRSIVTVVAIATLAVVAAASPGFPASTSPGKNAVFVSEYFDSGSPIVNATIRKALPGRVLAIEAMLTVIANGAPAQIWLGPPLINGVFPEPIGSTQNECSGTQLCTVTTTFWLDIDAHPTFRGQPLDIFLQTGVSGGAMSGHVTLTGRMERK